MKKQGVKVAKLVETFNTVGVIMVWPVALAEAVAGGRTFRWNNTRLCGLLEVIRRKESFRLLQLFAVHCGTWFSQLLEDTIPEEVVLESLNNFRIQLDLGNELPDVSTS